MADVDMDVRELTRITGVVDWESDVETEDGDAGTTGNFLFPNDGKVFLLVYADGGAGETLTFVGKNDKYGRPSADLDFDVATGKTVLCGPFSPALWNNSDGKVELALTTKHNSSKLLAVRITNTGTNGV